MIVRPAIFYRLDSKNSVWFGYEKIVNHPAKKVTFDEERFWQQYSHNFDSIESVTLQNRTRLEERRLDSGKETGYRLRQMIKASIPLDNNPKLSLIASDELFFNLNHTDWGVRGGFDQNRLFLGAGCVFNTHEKMETGYLNQYSSSTPIDKMNHVLSGTLALAF